MDIRPTRRHVLVAFACSFALPALSQPVMGEISDCLVEPVQQASIGSPVSGILQSVAGKRGSLIRQGETLATLNTQVEQASVALAQFKATQTAAIAVAERKQDFARRKWERRKSMAVESLLPQQDSDDAEGEFRLAEAELSLARENHRIAELEYQQQSAQLAQRTITSPFDGVVVEQSAYPGEVVEPGASSKPILKLAQLNPLRVQVVLPKDRFGAVHAGMRVMVTPEAPLKGRYAAVVKTVDKLIDAASGTFTVFLEIPNPKLIIPAGIKCQAAL